MDPVAVIASTDDQAWTYARAVDMPSRTYCWGAGSILRGMADDVPLSVAVYTRGWDAALTDREAETVMGVVRICLSPSAATGRLDGVPHGSEHNQLQGREGRHARRSTLQEMFDNQNEG